MARDLLLELKIAKKTLRSYVRLEASKRCDAILAIAEPALVESFWANDPSMQEVEEWVLNTIEQVFPQWTDLQAALPERSIATTNGRISDDEKRAHDREYQRRKYATDPAARERKRIRNAKRYAKGAA